MAGEPSAMEVDGGTKVGVGGGGEDNWGRWSWTAKSKIHDFAKSQASGSAIFASGAKIQFFSDLLFESWSLHSYQYIEQ